VAEEALQQLAQSLGVLLAEGTIPPAQVPHVETLVRQLTQPVRLTVMGPPGSGKSTLVNLLIGASALAPVRNLPTIEVVWGDTACCICTLPDGRERRMAAFDAATVASLSPRFVRIELPLPALRKISVMELALPSEQAEVERALSWAVGRTDIALWCTQRFGAGERLVWSGVDEAMQDHAYLLLTKADTLVANGTLDPTLAQLRAGADQFRHVLAIATTEAIAARRADGSIDREQLTRSGGRALIAAIMRDIDMGRDAARDRAELVLHQFGQPVQAKVAAPSAAAGVAPAPKPAPLILTEPLAPPAPKIVQPRRPSPRPATATHTPQPVVPARPVVPQKGTALREICEPALGRIARHGREADATMRAAGASGLARLAEDTAALVQWISDHLDGAPSGAPGLVELREAAFDAADLVQLMQLEGGPATLGESLSLLIQLKHEIETALARSEVAIPAAFTPAARFGAPMAQT
jgi:energy-coupling factor transporter ATP-binding protein EcfA2